MKTDYCGPTGSGWFVRFVSWLVPDKVFGVYLGCSCELHDRMYREGVDRKLADRKFREYIRTEFAHRKRLGYLVAYWYWAGVRIGGAFAYSNE